MIAPLHGFCGSMSLSASGLPAGVTAGFSPNPATSTSTLTLTVASTVATGTYPLTITGTSGSLNHTTSLTLTVTAAPSITLSASAGDSQVSLSWTDTSGAVSYDVKRSATSGGPYTTIASNQTGTTYTDTGLTNGTTYFYIVSGVNGSGQEYINSNEASATPGVQSPTDLAAYATGDGKITLYWSAVPNATGYNVYRGTTAGGEDYEHPVNGPTPVTTFSFPGSTSLIYSDTGLSNSTEYFYTVKALYSSGASASSNEDSTIPDPNGVPWDTEDPTQIVPKVNATALNNLTQYETEVGILIIAGPDGMTYQGNYPDGSPPQALPALGTLDTDTNTITYSDGTVLPAPPNDEDVSGDGSSMIPSSLDANAFSPAVAGCPTLNQMLNYSYPAKQPATKPGTGIYRKVDAQPGYRGLQGLITLPDPQDHNSFDPTSANLLVYANGGHNFPDQAYIYTGGNVYGVAGTELDIGLQLGNTTTDIGWKPFILPKRNPKRIILGSPPNTQEFMGNQVTHVLCEVKPDVKPLITFKAPGYRGGAQRPVENNTVYLTVTGDIAATYLTKNPDGSINRHTREPVSACTYVYAGVTGWNQRSCNIIKRANSIAQALQNSDPKLPPDKQFLKYAPPGNGPGGGFYMSGSFIFGATWGAETGDPDMPVQVSLWNGAWVTWDSTTQVTYKEGSYPGPSYTYVRKNEDSPFSYETYIKLKTQLTNPRN